MKILVLGARGMLGQWLVQEFINDECIGWDRDQLNITDETATRTKITAIAPQVIINAAAYTDVDGAENDQTTAFHVNETAVRNIALAAKDLDATIVHYSTDYIFPGNNKKGYEENDTPGPAVNVYGASKLAGEQALQSIQPKFYLIRTAWLYGPVIPGSHPNFVDNIIKLGRGKIKDAKSSSGRPELRVVNDQHGSPTSAKDLAQATKHLLVNNYSPDIYHLVNMGVTTWYDFAKEIFSSLHLELNISPVSSSDFPRPASRPKYSILNNTHGPRMRAWPIALQDYISQLTK